MMDVIEKIKHDGATKALINSISNLIHELSSRNFDGIMDKGKYIRLSDAISDGRNILIQIEHRLDALKEMDGEHD